MFDEMRFLFSVDPNIKNNYNSAGGNSIVNSTNPAQSVTYKNEWSEKDKKFNVNEYIVDKVGVKDNYIMSNVNKLYTSNNNPYLDLLKETNESTSPAMKLKSSDLAYLRDIGVMPINRLMILRRFGEGKVVPVDISDFPARPISTVIGWV